MNKLTLLVLLVLLSACGSTQQMNSFDQTAIQQQQARGTAGPPNQTPPRCQRTMVSSDGPLGGPLEHVRVQVFVDDKPAYEGVTNRDGTFDVCIGKNRSLFTEGKYDNRGARVRLVIEHPGYEPNETAFPFDPNKPETEPSVRIILRRSGK